MTEVTSSANSRDKRASGRLRGILKTVLGIVVAVVLVLAVSYAVATWIAYRTLNARLAELRSLGLPLEVEEIFAQVGGEGQQAAYQIRELEERFSSLQPNVDDLWRRYTEAEDWPTQSDIEFLGQLAKGPEWKVVRDTVTRLASREGLLVVCTRGQRSNALEDVILSPLIELSQSVRRLNRFLVLWAEYYHLTGDADRALEVVCLGLRFNRVQLPLMVGGLIRHACFLTQVQCANEILQKSAVSQERLAELETRLAEMDLIGAWQLALATERAFGLEQFRKFPCGQAWCREFFWVRAVLNYLDTVDLVRAYVEQAGGGRQNLQEELRASLEVAARRRWSFLNPVVELLVPAFDSAKNAFARGIILRNALFVLSRLEQAGPEAKANEVLAQLPEDFRRDPFSGGDLRVVRTEAGWLIYSVGPDGVDDGGEIESNKDWGLAPPT